MSTPQQVRINDIIGMGAFIDSSRAVDWLLVTLFRAMKPVHMYPSAHGLANTPIHPSSRCH
jgi:hypothetical protein